MVSRRRDDDAVVAVPVAAWDGGDPRKLVTREWLVTNGLGGYASGSVAGTNTRRYHGLLIAALPAPHGRLVMLNHLGERVRRADGTDAVLAADVHQTDPSAVPGAAYLDEFALENGLPVWRYRIDGRRIEKRILVPHQQNTVHVTFRLLDGGAPLRLKLRPGIHVRPLEDAVGPLPAEPYRLSIVGDRFEVATGADLPPLRLLLRGERASLGVAPRTLPGIFYQVEQERGYPSVGELWTPGELRADLTKDRPVTLAASVEPWEVVEALDADSLLRAEDARRRRLLELADSRVRDDWTSALVLAADQFVVTPAGRPAEAARARASGDEVRSIVAGYPWFTDWGRHTMISLEGLTLVTGRQREAGYILRAFAHDVRDGLIPNYFPDGANQGVYHTADATLWFVHAIARYVDVSGDRDTLRALLPTLREIIAAHVRGTDFGIQVDPADGLLSQGAAGYQLTWMDAKVGDWVVTPRRGKAVEINALWYNALRLLEGWLHDASDASGAKEVADLASRAYASFNARFWYAAGGYLYDVVDGPDGDDPKCRPNQIFAISLPRPVLAPERWASVVAFVEDRLVTPVGLRSLAPGDPEYKARYDGDLRARDAAYHQGTVWPWLIGPFVDAWLRVHPDDLAGARRFLEGFRPTLREFGLGTIGEIFDAEPPYAPRGCIAQAWSVAEVLRAWARTSRPGKATGRVEAWRRPATGGQLGGKGRG